MRTASDIPRLVDRVLSLAKGEARGWMIELAGILNRTVPCPRCEGMGWHRKHRNCGHAAHDAYCRGCDDRVECRKCGASGRLPKSVEATTEATS